MDKNSKGFSFSAKTDTEQKREKRRKKNAPASSRVVLPILIDEWPRNGSEVIRLTLERYRGFYRADLRIWFLDDGGVLRRTRRGVPIPLEDLVSIRKGLRKAERIAVENGLLGIPVIGPKRVRSNWVVDVPVEKQKQ